MRRRPLPFLAALVASAAAQPTSLDLSPAFVLGAPEPHPQTVWINEIHHSNAGPDVGEGVEIAGPAGTDLAGWRLWFYSGFGTLYSVSSPDGTAFESLALGGTLDDEAGGLGTVWIDLQALRSGCNGYALTDPDGVLVQFLSTGGCRFNAVEGPVYDLALAAGAADPAHPDALAWSTAIQGPPGASPRRRVQEWNGMPAGYSLQLVGAGSVYPDFGWGGPHPATPGRLNDYQAPATGTGGALALSAASGRAAGAPVGLVAPAVDADRDEDAPSAPAPPTGPPSVPELLVGRPYPNPATRSLRIDAEIPTGAVAHGEVYDALGRRVARIDVRAHTEFDVSTLAPGTYLLLLTAPGLADTAVTHRFTVAR